MTDWYLGNAEAQHAVHPRSFFIPTREKREALEPGEDARLGFYRHEVGPDEPDAERMWVEISRRDGDQYVGTLTNEPLYIKDLQPGDEVRFGPEHVLAIDDPRWYPYTDIKAVVAVRLVEDDRLEPGWIVHEAPMNDADSGWELFVGDETEAMLDETDNFLLGELAWLMERYPVFGALVMSGAREGEWRRDPDTGFYVSDAQTINATDS